MNETSFLVKFVLITATTLSLIVCSQETPQTLVTIDDARVNTAQYIDIG